MARLPSRGNGRRANCSDMSCIPLLNFKTINLASFKGVNCMFWGKRFHSSQPTSTGRGLLQSLIQSRFLSPLYKAKAQGLHLSSHLKNEFHLSCGLYFLSHIIYGVFIFINSSSRPGRPRPLSSNRTGMYLYMCHTHKKI